MTLATMTARKTRARSASTAPPARRRRVVERVLIFIGCMLLIDALVGERGIVALVRARTERQQLESQLSALWAESARLQAEVKRLNEDPAAIEELARRNLGLIKPGEKLFIIKDVSPEDAGRGGSAPQPRDGDPAEER